MTEYEMVVLERLKAISVLMDEVTEAVGQVSESARELSAALESLYKYCKREVE